MARRTTDTAANLVQLRQTHIVCVLDDKRVRVRNINAGFNNRGADQNINLAVCHLVHNLCDLFLPHFAVNDADSRIRKPLLPHGSHIARWTPRGCADSIPGPPRPSSRRMASSSTPSFCSSTNVCTGWRFCGGSSMEDISRIPDSAMLSVRGIGVADSVSTSTFLLISLSVSLCPTPNPLFLVHDEQTEILELDLLVEQLVRADNQIDRSRLQLFEQRSLLRTGLIAR